MVASSRVVGAPLLDAERMRRFRWRARRGLLENDILLERYLESRAQGIPEDEAGALDRLLDLTDPVLLDLILGRTEPDGDLSSPAVLALLRILRRI